MSAHSTTDQFSSSWLTYNGRNCNIQFKAEEYNSCDCNIYIQYILTCSKCKDFLVYHEKGQAIMDKVFHERFARHKVTMKEEILSVKEATI